MALVHLGEPGKKGMLVYKKIGHGPVVETDRERYTVCLRISSVRQPVSNECIGK